MKEEMIEICFDGDAGEFYMKCSLAQIRQALAGKGLEVVEKKEWTKLQVKFSSESCTSCQIGKPTPEPELPEKILLTDICHKPNRQELFMNNQTNYLIDCIQNLREQVKKITENYQKIILEYTEAVQNWKNWEDYVKETIRNFNKRLDKLESKDE